MKFGLIVFLTPYFPMYVVLQSICPSFPALLLPKNDLMRAPRLQHVKLIIHRGTLALLSAILASLTSEPDFLRKKAVP